MQYRESDGAVSERWIVMGFYQDRDVANSALAELRKQQFNRSASIHHSSDGAIVVSRGRIPNRLILMYQNWVVRNETVVVVQAPPMDLVRVKDILRTDVGSPPITFAFHPKHVYVSTEQDAIHHLPPITLEAMRSTAGALAAGLRPTKSALASRQSLLQRLVANESDLKQVHQALAERAHTEQPASMSAVWLLDNAYILQEHIDDFLRNIPRGYYDELPVVADGPLAGLPRVYSIASELIMETDLRFDPERVTAFLQSFQEVSPLSIGELWAVPLMLRLRLIECVRRLAVDVEKHECEREQADLWANRLLTAARQDTERLTPFLTALAHAHPEPSACLADQLTAYLCDEDSVLPALERWLEARLGTPLARVIQQEHLDQSTDQVALSHAIASLQKLAQVDWRGLFETLCCVDVILRTDPSGIYPRMDFATRDEYRRAVEEIARGSHTPEVDVARTAIQLAESSPDELTKHVGYHLVDDGRDALELQCGCKPRTLKRLSRNAKRNAAPIYLSCIAIFTIICVVLFVTAAEVAGTRPIALLLLGLLAIIPASELVIQAANYVVTRQIPPAFLARMSFIEGVPDECRTLVVVPMMLLTPESICKEVENLEVRYLANPDANLCFGLLSDFSDAPRCEMPEDVERLDVVVHGIEELNARHGTGHFYLFHRKRSWSEGEGRWIGRERKRGKLEDLNIFLLGHSVPDADSLVRVGDPIGLTGIRFVITLDSDTQLPRDTARQLIETLAHPLNRPVISSDGRSVVRGYTIIQPSVRTSLPSATASVFSRLFTDASVTDPYMHRCSDVNQDLVGEGSYHGKGIYDLRAFHAILSTAFPVDHLLSHDLIEGAFVRVGLASDIELLDLFPADYLSYAKRLHRWVRGDWQIIDWLFNTVPAADNVRRINPLKAFNRWKIADNLRRSLLPISAIALLAVGWCLSEAPHDVSMFVGLVLLVPPLIELIIRLATSPWADVRLWHQLGASIVRAAVAAALLPHQAASTCDAIVRVIYRRTVSRRNLLEWQTAQDAHRVSMDGKRAKFILHLGWITLIAIVLGILLNVEFPGSLRSAEPFLALWISAPLLVLWTNTTTIGRATPELQETETRMLRQVARETWRFFSDFVGPQTNWLPPDNYQESLRTEIAQRTSPTNIGLSLLAPLVAHDFGWITPDEVDDRTSATLQTLEKLEKHQGHLLNWYDIGTLLPLSPNYVSMVDSGNFLGDLWALEQAYEDLVTGPVLGTAAVLGVQDVIDLIQLAPDMRGLEAHNIELTLLELSAILTPRPVSLEDIIVCLRKASPIVTKLLEVLDKSAQPSAGSWYWVHQIGVQVNAWNQMIDRYLTWVEILSRPPDGGLLGLGSEAHEWRRKALASVPSLRSLANGDLPGLSSLVALQGRTAELNLPAPVSIWLDALATATELSRYNADARLTHTASSVTSMNALANGINMRLLYDDKRRLFNIGYNVSERRMDEGHYDLMASEARLGSFIAIARGEVPMEHWWALGRPYGSAYGERVLLSWSGTMFEYLMPLLLTKSFENSVLDEACTASVRCQIAYGRRRNIPWGISEAAFSAIDANQIYQYRAFGIPGLGMKRGLEEDLVVSPYASALALLVLPVDAAHNISRLSRLGVRGSFGCYESIDYTRQQRQHGELGVVVYAYMAHHQGMILGAIDNALNQNIWQTRFHRNPSVRATESLLYERIPRDPAMVTVSSQPELIPELAPLTRAPSEGHTSTPNTPTPKTNLLSNGSYGVMVTNGGGGYSHWRDLAITRWTADVTCDAYGSFCYLKDIDTGEVWSTGHQPVCAIETQYAAVFTADKAEFNRRDDGFETKTEIVVSPEDDVEVRRITLINRSSRRRRVQLTTYAELALAEHKADRAHPAFSKMFIETEELQDHHALLATRRPRSHSEPQIWAMHVASCGASFEPDMQFETDRAQFIGRGRTAHRPLALDGALSNSVGAVLDPIFSLRRLVILEAGQRIQVSFVTGCAESREIAIKLAMKYEDFEASNRAIEMAWTHAQLELRHLRIQQDEAQLFQHIAGHVIYPDSRLRPAAERLAANVLGQSRLWAYGISGDLPIIAVTIGDLQDVDLVRQILTAHVYWQQRGLITDLVILNEEAVSYDQPLQDRLMSLVAARSQATGIDRAGGVFLRHSGQVPEEDRTLLLAAARIVLVAARGTLAQQLGTPRLTVQLPAPFIPGNKGNEGMSPPLPFMELDYFNGLGGFTRDGKEYAIYLGPGDQTPMPWINVMANPTFGTMVSESGSGATWCRNSQANRLTPWSNDPVSDPCSDAIYIRDEDSGSIWTPTPLPIRENDAYRIRHGQGYSVCEHNSHNIEQLLTTFVPVDSTGGIAVRIQRLHLINRSNRRRKLTITFYCELALGATREDTQMHIVTEWDANARLLLARNRYNASDGKRVVFISSSQPVTSVSGDRTAFFGRNGRASAPRALDRKLLSGRVGAGMDPCAAIQVAVELGPNEAADVVFLLGEAENAEEARRIAENCRRVTVSAQLLQTTINWWDSLLGSIQIETPDHAANLILNRWLLYQDMSCRLWGRSAFYQSGGAYGFRDQLQDVMALVYASPNTAREHLLRAAARQFLEGDVQHWWHANDGAGVRTRVSDDLLWLPFVVAQYVRVTGDTGVLSEQVSFINGKVLEPGEIETFFVPEVTVERASLLEHCRRAIAKGFTTGQHGLPLMGSGDWNDSFSSVGIGGKGESVWLAWFLIHVLNDFAGLLDLQEEHAEASRCRERAITLKSGVEAAAWDGDWYVRAFFDDGSPLGSQHNTEAQIDSLSQSWGVISGAADLNRVSTAMHSVVERLVCKDEQIVRLFTPPFVSSKPDPGYIMGYPAGIRENGGQYTHGSLWVPMAFAQLGDGDRAVELLRMMNPVEHSRNPAAVQRYKVEPYVPAADIYDMPGGKGRGGWTWYTGAASWMYRIWLEEICGFQLRGETITFNPCIASEWNGFTLKYRYHSTNYEFRVENPHHVCRGVEYLTVDGVRSPVKAVTLKDDSGNHLVLVTMGQGDPQNRGTRQLTNQSSEQIADHEIEALIPAH